MASYSNVKSGNLSITGADEIIKALNKLSKNVATNVMVGAIRSGANIVRDEARRIVPKDTKNLEKSITTIRRKGDKNTVQFSITPSKGGRNDGWYGHFLELGTSKMSAKPFLRPSLDSKQDEVLQATKEYIAKRLPDEVEKAKR